MRRMKWTAEEPSPFAFTVKMTWYLTLFAKQLLMVGLFDLFRVHIMTSLFHGTQMYWVGLTFARPWSPQSNMRMFVASLRRVAHSSIVMSLPAISPVPRLSDVALPEASLSDPSLTALPSNTGSASPRVTPSELD